MIEYLKGIAHPVGENCLVVDVGGVGMRALCSMSTMSWAQSRTEDPITLYTYLAVRENNPPELFGFSSVEERTVFEQLREVKGVSGRIALNILSKFTPESIVMIIADQDDAQLQVASGVGKKLAERIVVELRERILRLNLPETDQAAVAGTSLSHDAIFGLVSLGYKNAQARTAVVAYMRANPSVSSAAEIIHSILKSR